MANPGTGKSSEKSLRAAERGAKPKNDQQAQQMAVSIDEGVNEWARRQLIEEQAYYMAERRGFAPGRELEDWLAAEAKVDLSIAESRVGAG